jgi:hypothetical protein
MYSKGQVEKRESLESIDYFQNDQAFLVFAQGVLFPAGNATDLYKVMNYFK